MCSNYERTIDREVLCFLPDIAGLYFFRIRSVEFVTVNYRDDYLYRKLQSFELALGIEKRAVIVHYRSASFLGPSLLLLRGAERDDT